MIVVRGGGGCMLCMLAWALVNEAASCCSVVIVGYVLDDVDADNVFTGGGG